VEKRHAALLTDEFIWFFEKAFETPRKLYPQDAWYGVHASCASLTIGNMWLAAIAAPPRCACLMVEHEFRVKGLGYMPIASTMRYVPLGFVTAKPWELIGILNGDEQVWVSYTRACELILHSPISRNVITRNLHRKARVSELV
jgi:hypothetical protein